MSFLTLFSTFWKFLLNLILWIFIILIYSIPISIGFAIHWTINQVAKIIHPDLLIPCSPNDILMVRETPDKQPIVNGGITLRVKGEVDYPKLQTLFTELFLTSENYENYKNLYCDLVKFCGYLFKRVIVKDKKNILMDEHFLYKILTDSENFETELASWYQTPFKEGFTLWQILLLYSPKSQESYLAIKAHHVLLDGYSLVHILDKLTGSVSPCLVKEDEEKDFWHEVKLFIGLPSVAIAYLLRHFWLPDNFPSVSHLTKVEMMPMTFGTADLEPLKKLRRQLNVHFPALIYSLQIGTIRRCLLETMREDELSNHTFLSTSFPVSGHPRTIFTNHWSGGTIKVPLRTSDPKERVLAANRSLEQMTKDDGPYLIWKYISYLNWLFPARLMYSMSFVNLSLYRYRSSISCIPQSPTQYYLMGQPVLNIYHVPIMKDSLPQAVMLGCSSSHKDQIDFSLIGHPELFLDQISMDRVMHVHFKEELEQLMKQSDLQSEVLNWREK